MTIVHSEAPWGQPQEERLAPKERTHPMRPLSRKNNTTTRLKRGPNLLSGVLILVLIFFFFLYFFLFYFFFFIYIYYLFSYFFLNLFFLLLLFFIYFFFFLHCLFVCFFFVFVFFILFFYICAYMWSPWGQPQQTIKSPGYREVLILSLGS